MNQLKNKLQAALESSVVPDPGVTMYQDHNATPDTEKLRTALQRWQSHLIEPGEQLQYVFYGQTWHFFSNLEVQGDEVPKDDSEYRKILDEEDKRPFNAVRSVAEELGFDVFFAETTKTAEQEDEDAERVDEYYDEDEDEDEEKEQEDNEAKSARWDARIEIDLLWDLDGNFVAGPTEFNPVELDQENELGECFLGPPEDEYVDRTTWAVGSPHTLRFCNVLT